VKRILLVLGLLAVLGFSGCSSGSGGLFSPDTGANFFGFAFFNYAPAQFPTLSTDMRAVVVTGNNEIFAGSADGLFQISPTTNPPTFTKITDAALTNNNIYSLVLEATGDLLLGTANGVYRRNAQTKLFTAISGLEGKNVYALAVGTDGTIWAGTDDLASAVRSVYRAPKNGIFADLGATNGLTASSVRYIYVDSEAMWACGIGGNGGVFRFTGTTFTREDVPFASGATCFFKNGAVWHAGVPDTGLYKSSLSSTGVRSWGQVDTLKGYTVYGYSSEITTQGTRHWIATDKGLALSYDLNNWNIYSVAKKNLLNDQCRSIAAGSNSVWTTHPTPTGGVTMGVFTP
jgi:ligand-binding sensor domain-containing protein